MIHQYKLNGYNIVLDVYSESVHITDDAAYEAIRYIDEGKSREEAAALLAQQYSDQGITAEDIADIFSDIDELSRNGKLFTEDIYKDHNYDMKQRNTVIKALCLLVAHTCNLNCEYCFASQGKFQGSSGLMSFETGKRALDFLVENSGFRKNLEVDFFGGEPLMNFEVCKQLVAYARSIEKEKNKNFRFTLTTNGVGITDEVIEWANKECHNVVLSLDGRKEVNDRFRVDYKGNGSYDRIVPLFKKFADSRGQKGYYMRGTYTHFNTDFTKDIFHMADDLGFKELSMEPVVTSPDSPSALTQEDLPVLFEQYEIQFVGDPDYKLGDIWNGVTNKEKQDEFKYCNVYSHEECGDCWAKLYCSGGCAANAYHTTGQIKGVYEYGCKLFKKRIECALMLKAASALDANAE